MCRPKRTTTTCSEGFMSRRYSEMLDASSRFTVGNKVGMRVKTQCSHIKHTT